MRRVTLASSSPVRRKLLQDAGLEFEVMPADLDEAPAKAQFQAQGLRPAPLALALAELKALDVSRRTTDLVIGADQTLEFKGVSYDKPRDLAEARRHLHAFRGQAHQLHSAAAVALNGVVLCRVFDTATLHVRDVSDAFVERYLDREGEAVLGCVGGYRLEGEGIQLFQRIEGDYFTILGLPLLALLSVLREHGGIAS